MLPERGICADILSLILPLLSSTDLKNCRLVCKAWVPECTRILFSRFVCHNQAMNVQAWVNAGLWSSVREIHADCSAGREDSLLENLKSALSGTRVISIKLVHLRCRCCPRRIFTGSWEPEMTAFWTVLDAVSSNPTIHLRMLSLAANIRDTQVRGLLPEIQSLLSEKLVGLRELVICGLLGDELPDFLSCCVNLKKLCLEVESFADLDRIQLLKLQELRARVRRFGYHFEKFLERHATLRCVVVSVVHWRAQYESLSKEYGRHYDYCGFFDLHTDPWKYEIIPEHLV